MKIVFNLRFSIFWKLFDAMRQSHTQKKLKEKKTQLFAKLVCIKRFLKNDKKKWNQTFFLAILGSVYYKFYKRIKTNYKAKKKM